MLDAVLDISVQSGRTLRLQHSKLLSPNTTNCTRDKIACSRTWNFVVFYVFLLRICLRHNFHMFCMQFSKMKMGSNAVWHFVWPWMAEQENGKRAEGTGQHGLPDKICLIFAWKEYITSNQGNLNLLSWARHSTMHGGSLAAFATCIWPIIRRLTDNLHTRGIPNNQVLPDLGRQWLWQSKTQLGKFKIISKHNTSFTRYLQYKSQKGIWRKCLY